MFLKPEVQVTIFSAGLLDWRVLARYWEQNTIVGIMFPYCYGNIVGKCDH